MNIYSPCETSPVHQATCPAVKARAALQHACFDEIRDPEERLGESMALGGDPWGPLTIFDNHWLDLVDGLDFGTYVQYVQVVPFSWE